MTRSQKKRVPPKIIRNAPWQNGVKAGFLISAYQAAHDKLSISIKYYLLLANYIVINVLAIRLER